MDSRKYEVVDVAEINGVRHFKGEIVPVTEHLANVLLAQGHIKFYTEPEKAVDASPSDPGESTAEEVSASASSQTDDDAGIESSTTDEGEAKADPETASEGESANV